MHHLMSVYVNSLIKQQQIGNLNESMLGKCYQDQHTSNIIIISKIRKYVIGVYLQISVKNKSVIFITSI